MEQICADLHAECDQLASLTGALSAEQWGTVTPFYRWTIRDEIAHLCYFEDEALLALTDAQRFGERAAQLGVRLGRGEQISALARERYNAMNGAELLRRWHERYTAVHEFLCGLDAKARLPWYGPSMSARSFAAARLMETWAHGQDIYDALRRPRINDDRILHIAHLGANTFGWSFVNRGLPVPEPVPYIELRAPSGEGWIWNPPSVDNWVKGHAEDFCLVVTQRRNVADTSLECRGDIARQWMSIAQCFAGPPADGPAPGARALEREAERADVAR